MPDQFFIDQYAKKAAHDDPVIQSGRGTSSDPKQFLFALREVLRILDLEPQHHLLDVGCANGLMDIGLSACCGHLTAIEPVPQLAALARQNLAHCDNVRVETGHGACVPAADRHFDRIVLLEVVQLVGPAELRDVFRELRRVAKTNARILLACVPDSRQKESFMTPYLAGVAAADHLSAEQKAEIVARNERSNWYSPEQLQQWWAELGCEAQEHEVSDAMPHADHRFHLSVTVRD